MLHGCLAFPVLIALAFQAQEGVPTLALRPGDALRITVQDEPTWSGDFPIAEDGSVLLPGIGAFRATGRPFAAVRDALLSAYRTQLVTPVVSISPLVRVAVLGEVQKPGLFPVDPTQGLADLLATAGGLTPWGNRKDIRLVRDDQVIAARLDPGSNTLNLPLRSGDQIFVGRRSWLSQNTPILLGAIGSVTTAIVASLLVR